MRTQVWIPGVHREVVGDYDIHVFVDQAGTMELRRPLLASSESGTRHGHSGLFYCQSHPVTLVAEAGTSFQNSEGTHFGSLSLYPAQILRLVYFDGIWKVVDAASYTTAHPLATTTPDAFSQGGGQSTVTARDSPFPSESPLLVSPSGSFRCQLGRAGIEVVPLDASEGVLAPWSFRYRFPPTSSLPTRWELTQEGELVLRDSRDRALWRSASVSEFNSPQFPPSLILEDTGALRIVDGRGVEIWNTWTALPGFALDQDRALVSSNRRYRTEVISGKFFIHDSETDQHKHILEGTWTDQTLWLTPDGTVVVSHPVLAIDSRGLLSVFAPAAVPDADPRDGVTLLTVGELPEESHCPSPNSSRLVLLDQGVLQVIGGSHPPRVLWEFSFHSTVG